MASPYEDIMTLAHPTSVHPPMSRHNRAAQFAPFAALAGYEDAIAEAGRTTETQITLDEDELQQLNYQLHLVAEQLPLRPRVNMTIFYPDEKKSGGAYRTLSARIRYIDLIHRQMITCGQDSIPMDNLIKLELTP